MTDLSSLDSRTARKIIDSLKSGTTPLEAAGYLDVGRDRWYRGMDYYLEEAAEGDSKVRFIKGYYGDGKTHLMGMARRSALEKNFAVSYASAEGMRLDRLEEVYKRVARQVETPEGPGGIEAILRRWKANSGPEASARLRGEVALDLNFRLALEGYLRAANPAEEDQIVQWLLGEPVQLRHLNINRRLQAGDSRDMMRSLSVFLRHIGLAGLLVLLDELDRIQNLTSRARQNCYQVLRELMDNTDGQGGMQGTLFYCAAPPEMFTSDRGFREYDALRTRMSNAGDDGANGMGVDYRGTIIDLERTPLKTEDYYEMARQVRSIHATARRWDAATVVTDEILKAKVEEIMDEGGSLSVSKPRLVATSIATILDLAQDSEAYDVRAVVNQVAKRTQEAHESAQHKKYED